jgi:NTE family protein
LNRKPSIGLALGSGSSRGWAHIGAIRALEARGVKPDIICGSSVGALVGGAFASGELERLEKWVTGLAWTTVVRLMDITWRGGLISGNRIFTVFRNNLFEKRDIADLPVKFGAIATELSTGREVWLQHGDLLDAVRASCAIPGLFAPVVRDERVLVDGGLVNPVPVSMCRALGADIVIAVDLSYSTMRAGSAGCCGDHARRSTRPASRRSSRSSIPHSTSSSSEWRGAASPAIRPTC